MPRARKRKGFNKRAHSEHPGVAIAREMSGERSIVVLRWRDPVATGHTGKRRKEIVCGPDGLPVTSRDAAKPAAIAKSKELEEEQARIEKGAQALNYDGTWQGLQDAHARYLKAKGSSSKTILDYAQTWPFLDSWHGRPPSPLKLTVEHLRGFVSHIKARRNRYTGEPLSLHSVAAILRHFKALLNYGRKELACVKLDGEAINRGLQMGKLPHLLPVALNSVSLCAILDAAREYDKTHPHAGLFPLLAFLMLTGCRRGEAENFRWFASKSGAAESWIDFDGERVVIYGAKTSRQRSVPLIDRPALRRLLETLHARVDVEAEPYVFGGPLPLAIAEKRREVTDGDNEENKPKGKRIGKSLKSAIVTVQRTSGVAWKLKDFRSTFASYSANSALGLNLYKLAGELGHDYAILTKHYAGHITLPESQARAATVDKMLGIEKALETWFTEQAQRKLKLVRA